MDYELFFWSAFLGLCVFVATTAGSIYNGDKYPFLNGLAAGVGGFFWWILIPLVFVGGITVNLYDLWRARKVGVRNE